MPACPAALFLIKPLAVHSKWYLSASSATLYLACDSRVPAYKYRRHPGTVPLVSPPRAKKSPGTQNSLPIALPHNDRCAFRPMIDQHAQPHPTRIASTCLCRLLLSLSCHVNIFRPRSIGQLSLFRARKLAARRHDRGDKNKNVCHSTKPLLSAEL